MRLLNVREMRGALDVVYFVEIIFEELLELHRLDCLGGLGKLDIYNYCKNTLESLNQNKLKPPRVLSGEDLIELGIRQDQS